MDDTEERHPLVPLWPPSMQSRFASLYLDASRHSGDLAPVPSSFMGPCYRHESHTSLGKTTDGHVTLHEIGVIYFGIGECGGLHEERTAALKDSTAPDSLSFELCLQSHKFRSIIGDLISVTSAPQRRASGVKAAYHSTALFEPGVGLVGHLSVVSLLCSKSSDR